MVDADHILQRAGYGWNRPYQLNWRVWSDPTISAKMADMVRPDHIHLHTKFGNVQNGPTVFPCPPYGLAGWTWRLTAIWTRCASFPNPGFFPDHHHDFFPQKIASQEKSILLSTVSRPPSQEPMSSHQEGPGLHREALPHGKSH